MRDDLTALLTKMPRTPLCVEVEFLIRTTAYRRRSRRGAVVRHCRALDDDIRRSAAAIDRLNAVRRAAGNCAVANCHIVGAGGSAAFNYNSACVAVNIHTFEQTSALPSRPA